jgi:hypothetical protein
MAESHEVGGVLISGDIVNVPPLCYNESTVSERAIDTYYP